MPCLASFETRRAAPTFLVPNWVGAAINRATPLGSGTYAHVFGCSDGSALKITGDDATQALSRAMLLRPVPGLPRVARASMLLRASRHYNAELMAISLPLLRPLEDWRARSVARAYRKALLQACQEIGYEGASARGAARFATRLACSKDRPMSRFSRRICRILADLARGNEEGGRIALALRELGDFCVREKCDIDLVMASNWMLDSDGRLVLNDPVVRKAYAF